MKNNIILIGMPAVGKSTAGVILAKLTGRVFIDTDILIQRSTGKLLRELICELGVDGFIELENRCLASLDAENAVIATGGSAVYGAQAMEHLSRTGKVVWLDLPLNILKRRLSDIDGRGVVSLPGQSVEDIYAQRLPLYKKYAEVCVDCSGLDTESTVHAIISKMK